MLVLLIQAKKRHGKEFFSILEIFSDQFGNLNWKYNILVLQDVCLYKCKWIEHT